MREFGGRDGGDARAAILESGRKALKSYALQDSVKQFDLRQYIFARQAAVLMSHNTLRTLFCVGLRLSPPQLLYALGDPVEVARRALDFILAFSGDLKQHEVTQPSPCAQALCSMQYAVCSMQYAVWVMQYGLWVQT